MGKIALITGAILIATNAFAQVGIGTSTPAASAALEVNSTTNNKGILIPRITAIQKDAISNAVEGLMIYQTSAPTGFYFYTGSSWILLVSQTDLDLKVAKVSGKELSSNDYTTAEKTKLASITGTNTGDQDLSALATVASVALKANATDLTNSLALKVDKETGKDLSSNDFTTTEKTKLANIIGINTGDQDLSALATVASVALKANIASPTFTGTPTAPTAIAGISTTQIATTAFVQNAVSTVSGASGVPYTGATAAVNLGAFDLKVNGLTVGKGLGNIATNTAIGVNALQANTTGYNNTANGVYSLLSNTTGFENTANGFAALVNNTTGNNNTANGVSSLFNNTTGSENTANGNYALYSNTEGSNNTANGSAALQANTTGNDNTANGNYALYSNTEGSSNTANGSAALYSNTDGSRNTANGIAALLANTTGNDNTANGFAALQVNTTGNNNTANGKYALRTNSTGNNNTAIGFEADVASNNLTNATAIGNEAIVDTDNKIQLGNGSVTAVQLGTGTNVTLKTGRIKLTGGSPALGKVLTSNADGLASWETPATGGGATTYTIGLSAEQGGYIFWISSDGKHGLVAETIDQGLPTTWFEAQNAISDPANHSTDGQKFRDWRLPTKFELKEMYTQKAAILGFIDNYYWSSTEFSRDFAWRHDFSIDNQNYRGKVYEFNVRAVRAF